MRSRVVLVCLLVAALAGCVSQSGPQDAGSNVSDPASEDPAPAEPRDGDATPASNGTAPAENATGSTNASLAVDLVWATNEAVVRWDPATGDRTPIALADAGQIMAIRWGPDGALYAAAASPGTPETGSVLRIDVGNGSAEVVHSGPPLVSPLALTVLDDGRILVADSGADLPLPGPAPDATGRIVEVAPDGTATILTADPRFGGWLGLGAVDGSVYLTTQNDQRMTSPTDAGGTGALWSIDPATGTHQLVSSSSVFQQPSGLTPAGNGSLYVSEWSGQRLLEVAPSSGEATVVSPVNGSQNLWGLDTLPDGRIVVADSGGIWVVDPGTGDARRLVQAEDGEPRHVRAVPAT